jgi:alpha-ketoglutarate-dependent taurine dioxygenase
MHKLDLDPDLFVRKSSSIVASRNGLYSVVSEEFDRQNPVAIGGVREFHTDGLYHNVIPDVVLMSCQNPGTQGIATLFVDSSRVVERLRASGLLSAFERFSVTYRYGSGAETRHNLIAKHAGTGRAIVHFGPGGTMRTTAPDAELSIADAAEYVRVLHEAFEQSIVLRHEWSSGDLLIFDNHMFVHGRQPGAPDSDRRLVRIWLST